MCNVSMVMGDGLRDIEKRLADRPQAQWNQWPSYAPNPTEIELLKKRIEKLEKDMAAAKLKDIEDGAPDCEDVDKKAALQKMADAIGVQIQFP